MINTFSIEGTLPLANVAGVELDTKLGGLSKALSERFNRIDVEPDVVSASSSTVVAWVFRGDRTHPMLPFDSVRLELIRGAAPQLRYRLGYRWSLVSLAYAAIGFSLLASIDRGMIKGVLIGGSLAVVWFLLCLGVAASRAPKWIRDRWSDTSQTQLA